MKTALVCIAKNEDNYIQEWIDYNFKLGFDHIFIYNNDWQYYNNDNRITILEINGQTRQVVAYNHFKKHLSEQFNWAAFFDVDEFLVLNKHNSLKDLLREYEDCNAIGINWAIFGNNEHDKIINNEYSVLKRFTKRNTENFDANGHIKTIIKLPCHHFQDVHNIHGTWYNLDKQTRNSPFNKPVKWDVAQLNHYLTKSTEEFYAKCERGRADHTDKRKFEEHKDYLNCNQIVDTKARDFLYPINTVR